MTGLRAWLRRVTGLWRGDRVDADFVDELESHIQLHVDDNLRAGLPPGEARRVALARLGGIVATRQAHHEQATLPRVEHLIRDARYALRQLARAPGFSAAALLLMTLGTGTAPTLFALVDTALLRPLPYPEPARLIYVTESTPQVPRANLSYYDYLDWKRLATTLDGFDVYNTRRAVFGAVDGSTVVNTVRVSSGFFRTLAVAPVLGRDFRPGEDGADAPPTVVLAYGAWQTHFAGDPAVVGRHITLNGVPHAVIGVLPRDFVFAPTGDTEFWTSLQPANSCDRRRSCHPLQGVARLAPATPLAAARAELEGIAAALERQYPDSNRDQGALVLPLSEVIVGEIGPLLWTLLAGASLLMLIACVNVGSLLLVRAESRTREFAVRRALGASRARIVAQLLTEALVLAVAGTAAGVLVAHFAVDLLVGLVPGDLRALMPFLADATLAGRPTIAAAMVAPVAAIAFAAASLSRAWAEPGAAGIGERGGTGRSWRTLGARLVVAELAMALVLLAGAGLLGRSLQRLLDVELNFRPEQLATVRITAPRSRYETDAKAARLGREIVGRVGALPGVESAALTSVLPVSFNGNTTWLRFVGRPFNGEHNEVNMRDVTAGYLTTIGARLVAGRHFTDADNEQAPGVAIVNRALARLYFPDRDPVGTQVGNTGLTPDSIRTIVGVVDDVREGALDDEIWPAIYYPFPQSPDSTFSLVVRTAGQPETQLTPIATALRDLDPELGLFAGDVMVDRIQDSTVAALRRSSAWLAAGYAAVALTLSILGVYAVVAYSVSRRTREFGVRLALGAHPRAVSRMVLREASALTTAGVAIGLLCAIGAATFMRGLLFGTEPWDVTTLGSVCLLLALAAIGASAVPARRASTVDPVEALRAE
jgi:predicted permease